MNQQTLDIPVKDLPFEAGKGFHAIVENGIAHVVVTTMEETGRGSGRQTSGTWAERAQKHAGKVRKQDLKKQAKTDERLSSILEKHAPSILD
jgi:hypothetical protein